MRSILTLLALGLVSLTTASAAEFTPPTTHPKSESWDNLFAPDLSNAVYPKGVWTVKDGVLTASEDRNIWTKETFGNCIIDLEFKTAAGSNSGLLVYCANIDNWIPNTVEIQILDDFAQRWAKVDPTWKCGAFFGHKAPEKQAVKKPGEWNRMTAVCRGKMIYLLLNGERVNSIDLSKWTSAKTNPDGSKIPEWLSIPYSELKTQGRLGLQGKHGDAAIYFRNIKVKKID